MEESAPFLPPTEKKQMLRKASAPFPDASLITDHLNNIMRRLRVLEERQMNTRRNTQVTDQNMLEHHRKISADIKTINAEMIEIKKELFDVKTKIRMIIKELQECAKKEEVQVVKKYINLWQPMNFVTQDEVENIIREILEEKKKKR